MLIFSDSHDPHFWYHESLFSHLVSLLLSIGLLLTDVCSHVSLQSATLLRRITLLLIVACLLLLIIKPDLTSISIRSIDTNQLSEVFSNQFLKPTMALSLGILLLCGTILRIFPSTYLFQLITTLLTALSFGFYIAVAFFPPNRVLRLLLYALVVIFGILLLHTFVSLQIPSSLTILLGDSLPFLFKFLFDLIHRAGIWGLVSLLLLGTGYAIFKNYPLRNGISR